ncbi:hypothetical protein B0H13DRAFT_2077591 [Mycena leptocephala]|nr:hypothetical protein B0H13DRAFT_2077591 [Mycena leptocephala]
MVYNDGVERLAAESLLEREKWVNRIWDAVEHLTLNESSGLSEESANESTPGYPETSNARSQSADNRRVPARTVIPRPRSMNFLRSRR